MTTAVIGLGYLVNPDKVATMLAAVQDSDRRDEIRECFYRFGNIHGKYFFGDIIVELVPGQYQTFEQLNQCFKIIDLEAFGPEYGQMLTECGISIEEVNEKWNEPEFYFLCMKSED